MGLINGRRVKNFPEVINLQRRHNRP